MKHFFFLPLAVCVFSTAAAQMSGNQVYRDRYSQHSEYSRLEAPKMVFVKDSLLLVSAGILLNAKADSLIVTLGLNQEEVTMAAANAAINKRLETFKSGLKNLGIPESHTYVDFISQTKIYDYSVNTSRATQYIKGFEIKKNISVRVPANSLFDQILEVAAQAAIYDIIKIDYIVSDMQRIYNEMLTAAAATVRQKKENYLRLSPIPVSEAGRLVSETFFAIYPNSQYKEYQAFESSDVSVSDRAMLVQTLARKNKTFYYDKINQSDFDRVINNSSPVVGIQYVLRIVMQYDVKK